MSRRRKPQLKPLASATESVIWRSRIMLEMLQPIDLPPQFRDPMKRWSEALEDYEASRNISPAQMELPA